MNGSPIDKNIPIIELKAEELAKYDCGSYKHPLFKNQKMVKGAPKPLLNELFNYIVNEVKNKRVKIYIEPIIHPFHPYATPGPNPFAKLIHIAVRKHKLMKQVFFMSRDYRILHELKHKFDWKYRVIPINDSDMPDSLYYARSISAYGIAPHFMWINKSEVKRLHSKGIKVFPWGANHSYIQGIFLSMGEPFIFWQYTEEIWFSSEITSCLSFVTAT